MRATRALRPLSAAHWSFLVLSCVAAAACSDSTKPIVVAKLAFVTAPSSSVPTGKPLTTQPVVQIEDDGGNAIRRAGVRVSAVLIAGGGTLSGTTAAVTNAAGEAQFTNLSLAGTSGDQTIAFSTAGAPPLMTMVYLAVDACSASSATSLSIGQVLTSLGGTSFCVAAGAAHQEYMLVPFYGDDTPGTSAASFTVTGTNLDALSTTVPVARGPFPTILPVVTDTRVRDLSFEARLRAAERRDLPRLLPSARAARARPSGLSRTAIPSNVQVGTLVKLNVNVNSACLNPIYKTGRVAAVSQKAIVVNDTTNPAGGFTDAQFQHVAVTFDTLVNPLEETAFGVPSDIDGNGRVIIFFTRAVNELTPPGSNSFVGGFFWARDLYPVTTCEASNEAEMFYLLAPDTGGVVGNKFPTAMVEQVTIGTTAHEFQHLINAARRMYVNTTATDYEVVWLNEGLSHAAEELTFFRESGLMPRQNIDGTALTYSAATVSAFNNYESQNFGRYASYLVKPSSFGPFVGNDSLPTRGATWAMLRYLVDHHGFDDGTQWYQLVNSTTTGVSNLENVFGTDVVNHIRDWSMSVYTDDVSFGVPSQWQQTSWNFRAIYPLLSSHLPYGLTPLALQSSTPLLLYLVPSGSAYVRFAAPAGTTALVQWGTLPTGMQMSVVRIQ